MNLSSTEAQRLALEFLVEDLEISEGDRPYLTIVSTQQAGSNWYVIEIGVKGLPDRWIVEVYDTHECNPCYTFTTPMPAFEDADLVSFPMSVAMAIASERTGGRL